jgi:hypothetical protein
LLLQIAEFLPFSKYILGFPALRGLQIFGAFIKKAKIFLSQGKLFLKSRGEILKFRGYFLKS